MNTWRKQMLVSDLHERLRALVGERIQARELTGTEMAKRAGFQQAHISNFLNRRRGLSVEAMDKVMTALGLTVSDLTPAENRKQAGGAGTERTFDSIPVVEPCILLQSEFSAGEVVEFLRFKKSFLRKMRPEMASQREHWQRFVMIRADKDSGEAMRPRLLPGAMLLIDRHYNSLQSYRRREPNLYVVKYGVGCKVRYVELQGNQLTLRPENQKCGLDYVEIQRSKTFADYIVGRVSHIAIET
jgi:transcriptional regulator with XRE-family HTH domain